MGNQNIWNRVKHLYWLLLVAVACFSLSILFPNWHIRWQMLLSSIGSAALVVFLLGITIDWWLKKSIVDDVFKAALGYLLPSELKPEMEWVYQQNVVAMQHIQWCSIEPLTDNLVTMRMKINRTLKNVSQSSRIIPVGLSVDEWFHQDKQSHIIDFGWRTADVTKSLRDGAFKIKQGKYGIDIERNEQTLSPGEEAETWVEYEEIKCANDEGSIGFSYSTKNPLVSVTVYEGLDAIVQFAHRKQKTLRELGHNQYRLDGTLLPGQQIIIRWWKISDSERWVEINKEEK